MTVTPAATRIVSLDLGAAFAQRRAHILGAVSAGGGEHLSQLLM